MPYAGDEHLFVLTIMLIGCLWGWTPACLSRKSLCLVPKDQLFVQGPSAGPAISQLCFEKVTELETQTNPKIGGSDEIKLMQLW